MRIYQEIGINMWWILQLIAAFLCAIINSIYYQYGFSLKVLSITIWLVLIAQYSFGRSFMIAKSFGAAWFVGTAALALFGFLCSLIVFDGALSLRAYIGIALTIIGACLLIPN